MVSSFTEEERQRSNERSKVNNQKKKHNMIEVTYVNHMGNDLTVVNSARVSFGKESRWHDHDSETDTVCLE